MTRQREASIASKVESTDGDEGCLSTTCTRSLAVVTESTGSYDHVALSVPSVFLFVNQLDEKRKEKEIRWHELPTKRKSSCRVSFLAFVRTGRMLINDLNTGGRVNDVNRA
mgnify:CR=1 FL=1